MRALRKSIQQLKIRGFCKEDPTKSLIPMKLKIKDQEILVAFPLYSNLAANLQRVGAPLQFECGFACECCTCKIGLPADLGSALLIEQPVGNAQNNHLQTLGQHPNQYYQVYLAFAFPVDSE